GFVHRCKRTPRLTGSLVVADFHFAGAPHRAQFGGRFWSLLQYYEHLFYDVHTRIRKPSKWSCSTPVIAGPSPSHRTIARHAPARPPQRCPATQHKRLRYHQQEWTVPPALGSALKLLSILAGARMQVIAFESGEFEISTFLARVAR
ncbi:unnamed protein product, partial [Mycena citricolor]